MKEGYEGVRRRREEGRKGREGTVFFCAVGLEEGGEECRERETQRKIRKRKNKKEAKWRSRLFGQWVWDYWILGLGETGVGGGGGARWPAGRTRFAAATSRLLLQQRYTQLAILWRGEIWKGKWTGKAGKGERDG